eukprot:14498_1
MATLLNILFSIVINAAINTATQDVTVGILFNNYAALSTDYFVSYTLDIANWFEPTNFSTVLRSETFQYMAKQLNPAILRIGGSAADKTYYFTDDTTGKCSNVPSGYNCFTKKK